MKKRCAQKSMQTGLGTNYESKNISGDRSSQVLETFKKEKYLGWSRKAKEGLQSWKTCLQGRECSLQTCAKRILVSRKLCDAEGFTDVYDLVGVESTQEDRKGLVHF